MVKHTHTFFRKLNVERIIVSVEMKNISEFFNEERHPIKNPVNEIFSLIQGFEELKV
jgi:hypothetical protein